ncbi:hypothetical protein NP233_g3922 [Leucocoprinus birnbaumii]|uniref:F-box domain-containing protein n=1 Tax=Leucocoprinus birnbaumii TaxID=56174 RepID=A0AAD5YTG5_9AGAR|nr:hypothetical protein NP233_g3922 [Leucocoprinus birnbaumii]
MDPAEARSDGLAKFPNEIMVSIFEHVLEPDPTAEIGGLFTLTLSHVCSVWRDLTWATPMLWSSPTFNPCHPDDLIALFFDNSQDIPVSLSLQHAERSAHAKLQKILKERPGKLGALYWNSIDSRGWANLCEILAIGLPKLRRCQLFIRGNGLPTDKETVVASLPSLYCLDLVHESGLIPPIFPLANITILQLQYVRPDYALNALLQCEKLERFYSTSYDWPSDTSQGQFLHVLAQGVTVLPNLIYLAWTLDESVWTTHLVENVKLPSLRKLVLHSPPHRGFLEAMNSSSTQRLALSFINSMPQLNELSCFSTCLQPTSTPSPEDNLFWSSLPRSIEKLSIEFIGPTSTSENLSSHLDIIFDRLTLRRQQVVLPNLKTLYVDKASWIPTTTGNNGMYDSLSSTVLNRAFQSFLAVVASRRHARLDTELISTSYSQIQHITISTTLRKWNPFPDVATMDESERELKRYVREGFKLEILISNGRTILWGTGDESIPKRDPILELYPTAQIVYQMTL